MNFVALWPWFCLVITAGYLSCITGFFLRRLRALECIYNYTVRWDVSVSHNTSTLIPLQIQLIQLFIKWLWAIFKSRKHIPSSDVTSDCSLIYPEQDNLMQCIWQRKLTVSRIVKFTEAILCAWGYLWSDLWPDTGLRDNFCVYAMVWTGSAKCGTYYMVHGNIFFYLTMHTFPFQSI